MEVKEDSFEKKILSKKQCFIKKGSNLYELHFLFAILGVLSCSIRKIAHYKILISNKNTQISGCMKNTLTNE